MDKSVSSKVRESAANRRNCKVVNPATTQGSRGPERRQGERLTGPAQDGLGCKCHHRVRLRSEGDMDAPSLPPSAQTEATITGQASVLWTVLSYLWRHPQLLIQGFLPLPERRHSQGGTYIWRWTSQLRKARKTDTWRSLAKSQRGRPQRAPRGWSLHPESAAGAPLGLHLRMHVRQNLTPASPTGEPSAGGGQGSQHAEEGVAEVRCVICSRGKGVPLDLTPAPAPLAGQQ